MGYTVQLENFEGPLDLLLHLIKKEEVDIYDIPIGKITEQYLQYIKNMREMDLEIASEFLVMAATLLSIKSRMLLPESDAEENDEEYEDPRQELVRHLVEYKKYKEAAEMLKQKAAKRGFYVTRPVDVEAWKEYFAGAKVGEGADPHSLRKAYLNVLDRNVSDKPRLINRERVTVVGQLQHIRKVLNICPSGITFRELYGKKAGLKIIVATFLALLELVRLRQVRVVQQSLFGDIFIYKRTKKTGSDTAGHTV